MRTRDRTVLVILSSSLVLAGCPESVLPPEAITGPDLQGVVGEAVQLDGSASQDPDGNALTFSWSFQSRPAGSTALLTGSTSPMASFVPDVGGVYVVALTVDNGHLTDSDDCTVTVNTRPVADAGPDQGPMAVGQAVVLDGSGSHDADGDDLAFSWSFHSRPAGSNAFLSNASGAASTFTPDMGGPYIVELVVSDGRHDSEPDRVTVMANTTPVAQAGADETVWVGDFVELDGGGSHDPDGDAITYLWSFASRPPASQASLTNATSKNPGMTPDVEGEFVVSLVVSDGKVDSDPDYVHITADLNDPPVAVAGSYATQAVGQVVQLDGTGSYDPENDPLTYAWSFSSRPSGSNVQLSDPSSATPTFTADLSGSYQVRLVVRDGRSDSDPDYATITVNTPPEAHAGPDRTVSVGTPVILNGSGSSDADGDALTYTWTLVDRPTGSGAQLSNASSATPSFTPDMEGPYVVRLVVNDGLASSDPDDVTITATMVNRPPDADAGPDQTVMEGEVVTLDGSASSDPDGDPLTYTWAFQSRPPSSAATLSGLHAVSPTFTADAAGTYVLRLTVDDGELAASDDVAITATNGNMPPAADAGPDQTVTAGDVVTLDGSGSSDPDGDPLTYTWTFQSRPPGSGATLSDLHAVSPTFTSDVAGGYVLRLTVSDGQLTDWDPVTITAEPETGPAPSIDAVGPSPLIEGGPATITGENFSPVPAENAVTVDGLPAEVTSASSTRLDIIVPVSDCWPPRDATLSVVRGGKQASADVTVEPGRFDHLDPGYGLALFNADFCLNLVGSSSEEEYLVGILSATESPSSLTAASLRARVGIPLTSPPRVAAPAPGTETFEVERTPLAESPHPTPQALRPLRLEEDTWQRNPAAEARIREREREDIRLLGGLDRVKGIVGAAAPPARRAPGPVPAVGDILTLYYDVGYSSRPTLDAEVRYVGTGAVWLEDVDNPGPAFAEGELQSLDDFLALTTLPVLESHFGTFEDVDANDRVLVVITKEVNKEEGLLGYVYGADILPASSWPASNEAEIFFGIAPDPTGIVGSAISKQELMEHVYPPLLPHELTHLVQYTGMLYGSAGAKTLWEMEGGATLAEKLVGHVVMGNGSRSNLGATALVDGWDWYSDWVGDLAYYFGWGPSGKVPGAPEECTWTGTPAEGNTGPCNGASRAVYGVPAWLLQFVIDRYGLAYPGGDAALMRRMTQSGFSGFSTLEDVAGGDLIKMILTLFGSALYVDGRTLDGLYWDLLASWDLFDIFGGLPMEYQLVPHLDATAEPALDVAVRGGSTAYLLWTPGSSHNPTSLRVRTPSDTSLPGHMAYWIWRLR